MIPAVSVLVGMSALFATITDTSAQWSGSAVLANSALSRNLVAGVSYGNRGRCDPLRKFSQESLLLVLAGISVPTEIRSPGSSSQSPGRGRLPR